MLRTVKFVMLLSFVFVVLNVEATNKTMVTQGCGAFYSVGYPSKAFHAVNGYALHAPQKLCFGGDLAEGHQGAQAGARMARFLNRKSQRRYRLKFADTYYGELNHYGMYWLKWADVRRRRN